MNVKSCLLLETKALWELLNVWGGKDVERMGKHVCSFPAPFSSPSLLNLGFGDPITGGIY